MLKFARVVNNYPLIAFSGEGKLHFFAIKARNVPGVLMKISKKLAEANVNILGGTHDAQGDVGVWVFAADFSKAEKSPEEIAREIEHVEEVLEVHHGVRRLGEVLMPAFEVQLRVLGDRALLWRLTWLKMLFRAILSEFQSAGRVFLYNAGMRAGRAMYYWWREQSEVKEPERIIVLLLELWKKLGWIEDYELVRVDPRAPNVQLRLRGGFEALVLKGAVTEPCCHFTAGVLAGFISGALREEMITVEKACEAAGAPHCEFVAEPCRIGIIRPEEERATTFTFGYG